VAIPSPQSNGTFLALDVDRYDGLAVVLGTARTATDETFSVRINFR
jgi:hypothetical protein